MPIHDHFVSFRNFSHTNLWEICTLIKFLDKVDTYADYTSAGYSRWQTHEGSERTLKELTNNPMIHAEIAETLRIKLFKFIYCWQTHEGSKRTLQELTNALYERYWGKNLHIIMAYFLFFPTLQPLIRLLLEVQRQNQSQKL